VGKYWVVYRTHRSWCAKKPEGKARKGVHEFRLLTAGWEYAIRLLPFRGLRVVAAWPRGSPVSGQFLASYIPPVEKFVKKVRIADRSTVKHLAAVETDVFKGHMALVEQLAMLQYGDGSPRQVGYFGLWTSGNLWVCRVQDKDAPAQLTAEGRTVDEALSMLCLYLGSEDAPWEAVKPQKRK